MNNDDSENEEPLFYDSDNDEASWQSRDDDSDDDGTFIITVDEGDEEGDFGAAVEEYEQKVTENIGKLLLQMDEKLYGEREFSDGDEEIKEWADAFPHLRVLGHKMVIHESPPQELVDQLKEQLNIEEDLA